MRILPFFIFVLLYLPAISQNNSTQSPYKLGVTVSSSVNIISGDLLIAPLMTVRKNKHQFELGPQFVYGQLNRDNRNIGVEFNYRYYPNGNDKRFEMFLFVNSNYINSFQEQSYILHSYSISGEVHGTVINTTKGYSATIHAGYGVQVNIFKGAYIGSNVGLGGGVSGYNSITISDNLDLNSSHSWKGSDISFIVGLHLGYRF